MNDDGQSTPALSGEGAERERLELVAELSTFGVWDWHLETGELFWSKRQMEILGVTPARFTSRAEAFFERIHPDDIDSVRAALDAHWERGVPYDVVLKMRHEAGHYIRQNVRGRAFRRADGTPYRMAGVVLAVTHEEDAVRALEESERRFHDMAVNVPGALFQYSIHPDGTDTIEYMSPGCFDLWEISAEAIQGDPGRLWDIIDEEDVAGMRQSVMRSAETLEPWSHQWRITTPSGQRKWIQGRGRPTRARDGTIVWNSLLLDITERMHAEEELRRSREILFRAQKMDALGQLTGGLAHDFNNLLSVILSGLEVIDHVGLADEQRLALRDALNATRRGGTLTRSLLSFARRASLDPEGLDLASVVQSMQSMFRRTLPANIELVVELADQAAQVCVDRAALENSLLNLVLNARDAIEGGGRVVIATAVVREHDHPDLGRGDFAVLSVADDGCGMAEETIARVFEPFFTTKGQRGTGMGLAMIHGFASQSGGLVEVTSEVGEGTKVVLWFPYQQALEKKPALIPTQARPAPVREAHVLLVEDEPSVQRSLVRVLRRAGFRVTAADDGVEALALLDGGEGFDLVLTDMQMPGPVQGDDVAEAVKGRLPVVLISGHPPGARADGATTYLAKPVGTRELLEAIEAALGA